MGPRRPTSSRSAAVAAVIGIAVVLASVLVVQRVIEQRGDESANGSIKVRDVGAIAGIWTTVNDVGAPAPVVQGSVVSLTFTGKSLRVVTGCNTLSGTARVVDSTLRVDDLVGTEMGCEPDVTRQEQWVAQMLQARPQLQLSGPTLSLLWGEHWIGLSAQPDGG